VNHTFSSWQKYLIVMIVPIGISLAAAVYDRFYLKLFVSALIVGPTFEWVLGAWYERITGQKLWVYQSSKGSQSHTSWLVLPYWGLAGVCFGILSKVLLNM
jgi:hypothetical protein